MNTADFNTNTCAQQKDAATPLCTGVEYENLLNCFYSTAQQAGLLVWIYDIRSRTIEKYTNAQHFSEKLYTSTTNMPESLIETGIVHPADIAALRHLYNEVHKGHNASVTMRWRINNQDTWWTSKIVYSVVLDAAGKPYKAVGAGFDISTLVAAETIYNTRLSQLLSLTPQTLGNFRINLSQNWCGDGRSTLPALLNLQKEGTVDDFFTRLYACLPPEERADFAHTMNRSALIAALQSGQHIVSCEHSLCLANEHLPWVGTTISLFQTPNHKDIEAVISIRNCITEKIHDKITHCVIYNDYEIIASIDSINHTATIFCSQEKNEDALFKDTKQYEKSIENYFITYCEKNDCNNLIQKAQLETVEQELQYQDCYTILFSVLYNNVKLYKKITFTLFDKQRGLICFSRVDITALVTAQKETAQALLVAQKHIEDQEKLRISEERYRIVAKQSKQYLLRYDIATKKAYASPEFITFFNTPSIIEHAPERVVLSGMVAQESIDEHYAMYAAIHRGESSGQYTVRLRVANRGLRWMRLHFTTIVNEQHKPEQAIIAFSDITEQRERDLVFNKWKQSLEALPQSSYSLYECTLTQLTLKRVRGTLICNEDNADESNFDLFVNTYAQHSVYPDDRSSYCALLTKENLIRNYYRGARTATLDYRALDKYNKEHWVHLSIEMIQYADSPEIKLFLLYKDIDEEKRAEIQLQLRAEKDQLTGLLNRAAFTKKVNELFSSSPQGVQHAIIMLDIDKFKEVNDTLGHIAGDMLLSDIAQHLHELMRNDDLLGRLGGDEFILCLKNIPNSDIVSKRANFICHMLQREYHAVSVSASLGVAFYPTHGTTLEELYACADQALYTAKNKGRNRFELYNPQTPSAILPRHCDKSYAVLDKDLHHSRLHSILAQNKILSERQEETDRYRIIIEMMQIVTFEFNFATDHFYSSQGFEDYALHTEIRSVLLRHSCPTQCIHPDDIYIFNADFIEKLRHGTEKMESVLRLAKTDGSYQLCRISLVLLRDAKGNLHRAIGTINSVDMTAEEARIKLEALLNYMEAGVVLLEMGTDTRILYASPNYCTMMHTTLDDIASPNYRSGIEEHDKELLVRQLYKCANQASLFENFYRITIQGKQVWHHIRAARIPYEGSPHPVMLCIITDVTQLKEHQKTLDTVNNVVGIYRIQIDAEFTVRYGNELYYSMYGYEDNEDMKETINLKALRYVHPNFRANTVAILKKAIAAQQKQVNFVVRIITKQGELRWHFVWGALVQEGTSYSLIGCVLDITEIKERKQGIQQKINTLLTRQASMQ